MKGNSLRTGKASFNAKLLLLEYQRNDIDNCLVLFLICLIRFVFNLTFLPVEMADFLQKVPLENL